MKQQTKNIDDYDVHLKCIICDYDVFTDYDWYIDNYNNDNDGWFNCPSCKNDSLSVIEDYNIFKSIIKK